jgi:hypothetical protein
MWQQQMDSATRTASPVGAKKTVAVTVIGLITLLLGGAYAVLGGQLIWAGASWAGRADGDPWGQFASLFGIIPALLIVVGVAFLLPSLLGLLAGSGALLREQWGRILTLILAGLAMPLGVVWMAAANQNAADIALGAAQVLYGILAFVILIGNGAEFSRLRA